MDTSVNKKNTVFSQTVFFKSDRPQYNLKSDNYECSRDYRYTVGKRQDLETFGRPTYWHQGYPLGLLAYWLGKYILKELSSQIFIYSNFRLFLSGSTFLLTFRCVYLPRRVDHLARMLEGAAQRPAPEPCAALGVACPVSAKNISLSVCLFHSFLCPVANKQWPNNVSITVAYGHL